MEEVELSLKNELIDIGCICKSGLATEECMLHLMDMMLFKPRMTPNDITVK